MTDEILVIAIDGPSGSGKGTISQLLAQKLGWHLLDSGALYRVLAYAAHQKNISLNDEKALEYLAKQLDVRFKIIELAKAPHVFLQDEDISQGIRSETIGMDASKIAAFPFVREALLERQRAFKQLPGLVADGRDMGTTVFPNAAVKFYLTASPEERAKRRYKQLLAQGIDVKLAALIEEIALRDRRDQERLASPLKIADDAIIVNTTGLTIHEVFAKVYDELVRVNIFTERLD